MKTAAEVWVTHLPLSWSDAVPGEDKGLADNDSLQAGAQRDCQTCWEGLLYKIRPSAVILSSVLFSSLIFSRSLNHCSAGLLSFLCYFIPLFLQSSFNFNFKIFVFFLISFSQNGLRLSTICAHCSGPFCRYRACSSKLWYVFSIRWYSKRGLTYPSPPLQP